MDTPQMMTVFDTISANDALHKFDKTMKDDYTQIAILQINLQQK